MRFLVCSIFILLFVTAIPTHIHARQVDVKYRGVIDTENGDFRVYDLKPSSLVYEILYDRTKNYLLVNLKDTFYHYCSIPNEVVTSWIMAPSLGRFYLSNIKGNYDCRIYPPPEYHPQSKQKK